MRVVEATIAGLVVGIVAALIGWRIDSDPLFLGGVVFLLGFGAWMASGRTSQHYGRGRLSLSTTRRRRRRRH